MTFQDLGSIGELVAAIATIATLVYLAAQVRQNTRALRSSIEQSMLAILQNPGAAQWWAASKVTFHKRFTDHVDAWLASNAAPDRHPGLGIPIE